jgi:hypothetical protein
MSTFHSEAEMVGCEIFSGFLEKNVHHISGRAFALDGGLLAIRTFRHLSILSDHLWLGIFSESRHIIASCNFLRKQVSLGGLMF